MQDVADRSCRREALAFLVLLDRAGCPRGREFHHDGARLRTNSDWVARVAEHLQHRVVLGQDVGMEPRDPLFGRCLRQMGDQDRTESEALEVVGDAHPDLC